MTDPFTLFRQPNSPFYSVSFTVNGIRIRKSLRETEHGKAKDKAFHVYYEAKVKSEKGIDPRPRTVDALIKEFIATLSGKKHAKPALMRYMSEFFMGKSPKTINEDSLKDLVEFRRSYWMTGPGKDHDGIMTMRRGRKFLYQIGTSKTKPPSENTIRIDLISINAFLEYIKNKKYIDYVPKLKTVNVKNPRPSFTEKEVADILVGVNENLIKAVSTQDAVKKVMFLYFIEFMLATGCRPLEVKNIRWGDVSGFKRGARIGNKQDITIRMTGKGMSRTTVPQPTIVSVLDSLYETFELHFGEPPTSEDYLFFGLNGGPRKVLFAKQFNKLMVAMNLRYDHRGQLRSSYSFRHYYITKMLALGIDPYILARNLGTSPAQLLAHYDHNAIERYRDALTPREYML